MADTADRILGDLRRRRDELRPLVTELERIEAAIEALERAEDTPAPATATGNGTSAAPRRRGRPRKGEANRTDQFLALIRQGRISITAAAQEMGIGPNYLYRLAATLESEGTIRKNGREYEMAVQGDPNDDNAEVLSPPDQSGDPKGDEHHGDDLVTDEGVNEGTRELSDE